MEKLTHERSGATSARKVVRLRKCRQSPALPPIRGQRIEGRQSALRDHLPTLLIRSAPRVPSQCSRGGGELRPLPAACTEPAVGWSQQQLLRISSKGDLARAFRYGLSRQTPFCLFLEDCRVAIDNNAVERALRPIGMGRKNWLFAGADSDVETLARAMTHHRNCKAQRPQSTSLSGRHSRPYPRS